MWPVILFLSSHLTGPKTLAKMPVQLFAKMDSTTEAYGYTYYGVGPLPFSIPQKPSCTFADREVFLDLRNRYLISLLSQSSAFATSFLLGISGWEQSFSFTLLDKSSCPAQGPICLLPQFCWAGRGCWEVNRLSFIRPFNTHLMSVSCGSGPVLRVRDK